MVESKMTKTRIIGDIHGNVHAYKTILENWKGPSVQIGDFGIGFAGASWHDSVNGYHTENPQHRFIRGNHDDPDMCKNDMLGYINDGTVEGDVMYVGGAWSIDYQQRTRGLDWWEDEELSYEELSNMIVLYNKVRPRVIITHDCPTSVAYEMFISKNRSMSGTFQFKTRTAEAFEQMFAFHKPDHWLFGHWHHSVNQNILGTQFQCIDINDFVDIEL